MRRFAQDLNMDKMYKNAFEKACNRVSKSTASIAREAIAETEITKSNVYATPITNIKEAQRIAKELMSIVLFIDYTKVNLGNVLYKQLFMSVEVNKDMKLLLISMNKSDIELMFHDAQ